MRVHHLALFEHNVLLLQLIALLLQECLFPEPPLQAHAESFHCSFTIVVGMPISSLTVVHARLDDGSPLLQAVRACDLGIGACGA